MPAQLADERCTDVEFRCPHTICFLKSRKIRCLSCSVCVPKVISSAWCVRKRGNTVNMDNSR